MVAREKTSWPAVFRDVRATLGDEASRDLRAFHWSATSWMAKAWYGNRAIHYEIWVRHRARVVELGLHFEADELTNARLLGAFRARATQVTRALGREVRIEEWDKGWARIWEPLSLEMPDAELAEQVRTRFAGYVRVLEPMVREELPADVEWKPKRAALRAAGATKTRAISPRRSRSARR